MLKKLELENFRNYQQLKLEFGRETGLTYLIGDNGQGKTNLLEAIYLLALTRSFRVSDEDSLINWESQFARVKGLFAEAGTRDLQLELFLGRQPQPGRVCKINGVRTAVSAFLGQVRVVFFHPEDLNMLYLGPDLRRRYLDVLLVQKNRAYFEALRRFRRLKEQRNALLVSIRERRAEEDQLTVWDEQLVPEGVTLWQERARVLDFLQQRLSACYSEIAGGKNSLDLTYQNSLGLDFRQMPSDDVLAKHYAERLWASRQRDIASGHTQPGPQRDDMLISLEGIPIVRHASRGEFRTILLALKLIEMEYFADDGNLPLLLLDDVFSELDYARQRFLLERVVNFQTFIATTKDSAVINREKLLAGDFVEITAGVVSGS
jgi:DNA replication and repair protein RecF